MSNVEYPSLKCKIIYTTPRLHPKLLHNEQKYVYTSNNGVHHAHGSSNYGYRISLPSKYSMRRGCRCIMRYQSMHHEVSYGHVNKFPTSSGTTRLYRLENPSFAASRHSSPRLAILSLTRHASYPYPSFATTLHDFLRVSILRPDSPSFPPTHYDRHFEYSPLCGKFCTDWDRTTTPSITTPGRALSICKLENGSGIWGYSWAAGGPNRYFCGNGGCCSASCHRLTMES